MSSRPRIDFGVRAEDYARHRPGFPGELFDRVRALGVGLHGQRVLDLGAGTGTLARGFAARGCRAVALDPSPGMLGAAREAGVDARLALVRAWAEAVPFADGAFDVVAAGQCWHWFDRARAAREVRRVLAPRGRALIAYFTYLVDPGTPGALTEELILAFHPEWGYAGSSGRHPELAGDLAQAGLSILEIFDFDVAVEFTHESWRGRFRACNGVFTLPAARAAEFDAALAVKLKGALADPFMAPHRVFGIVAESAP